MENWSPRTKLRVGLCTLDDDGNIVSIWNFGEWGEVLNGIDIVEPSERVQSPQAKNVEFGSMLTTDHRRNGQAITVIEQEDTTHWDGDLSFEQVQCNGMEEDEMPPLLGPEQFIGSIEEMPDLEVCTATNDQARGNGKSDCKAIATCPVCVVERFERLGTSSLPIGFPGHVPFIRRLQQLYRTPVLARYMTIHSRQ